MKKFMKNKSKKIIIVIAIIIVVFVILINTSFYKIQKANMIYGKEYCTKNEKQSSLYEDKEHPLYGGDAITMYRCKICGTIKQNSTTSTPKICTECATITNRCQQCGKLKK